MEAPFRVLFLSQRNSARSIIAEALLNAMGRGTFVAFSAGVRPAVAIEPLVLEVLAHAQISPAGLRPKHFAEFSAPGAAPLDFVFTLSDTAAGEAPPQWPGYPVTAHWRSGDPIRFPEGRSERRLTLVAVRAELERRLSIFMNLPPQSLSRMSLLERTRAIGGETPRDPGPNVPAGSAPGGGC